MEKTSHITDAVFTQMLDLAAALIASGADVNLVETSLVRLGEAYGAVQTDAFVITSNMVVTMRDANGGVFSQTRRIHTAMSNDFDKLERLNALCSRCCDELLNAGQIEAELAAVRAARPSKLKVYLGSVLAAGTFAAFFGGTVADAAVAAVFAVLICALSEHVKPYCPNEIVFNFIAALASGLGICACVLAFDGLHGDMIIIGDIMLLIPGIALTNSMRDMLAGDTGSGALRFLEAVLWAAALALGFTLAAWMVGADVDTGSEPLGSVQMAMALPASLGFGLMFNLRPKHLAFTAVGGLLTWAVYALFVQLLGGIFIPCLIASALAAAYAQVLARAFKAPISIFYIICQIPLIPGRGLYYTVSNAVQGKWEAVQSFGFMTGTYVLAIAFGIAIAWAIGEIVRRYARAGQRAA